jgi:hypothetical protein
MGMLVPSESLRLGIVTLRFAIVLCSGGFVEVFFVYTLG